MEYARYIPEQVYLNCIQFPSYLQIELHMHQSASRPSLKVKSWQEKKNSRNYWPQSAVWNWTRQSILRSRLQISCDKKNKSLPINYNLYCSVSHFSWNTHVRYSCPIETRTWTWRYDTPSIWKKLREIEHLTRIWIQNLHQLQWDWLRL